MRDGYCVRGRFWPATADARLAETPEHGDESTPSGRTRVGVIYLHGIQSHGGWYEWSGSVLASCELTVVMPDRRGSGLNQAARGDVPAMQSWFDDVDDIAAWLAREHGIQRFAVVGVSWGGKLAFAWARRRENLSNAAVPSPTLLIAPGLFPRVGVGLTGRLAVAWSWIANPTLQVDIPLQEPALFTANIAAQRFIAADPLKLTRVTGRFLYNSHLLDRELIGVRSGVSQSRTTLLLAGADRIIRNESTCRWLAAATATSPRIQTYAEAGHTIEFETCVSEFEMELRKWAESVKDYG